MSPERLLRRLAAGIAVLGLAAAVLIVATTPAEDADVESGVQVAGLSISRAYRRDIQRAGGWAAVAAAEFGEWLSAVVRGRRLAGTVATLSLVAAAGCWIAARRLAARHETRT